MHVLSREYLAQAAGNVPPEEHYLYRYLQQTDTLQRLKKKKKVKEEEEEDAESVASDDVEAVLDMCEPGVDGELDFAGDFVSSQEKAKKRKSRGGSDEDEDDDDLDDDDAEDDLEGLEDDEEYKEALKGLNLSKGIKEEDIEFSDEDEFGDGAPRSRKTVKPGKPGKAKDKAFNMSGLLASAEEFSHLLEDNSAGGLDLTSSQAMSNKDKASAKQLKWEANRDAWVRGEDWRSRKRKFGGGKRMPGKRRK